MSRSFHRFIGVVIGCVLVLAQARAESASTDPPVAPAAAPSFEPEKKYAKEDRKRIGGILPNFRTTSIDAADLKPLTIKEKFKLASKDAFDPGAFFTMGLLAGISHANHQYPSIPLGARGFGQRYGLIFADNVSSVYFIEAIVPAIVHQDPRYFRKGTGSGIRRVAYSISRNFVIQTDRRNTRINAPELLGVGASSALGNLYYPAAERSARNTAIRFGMGIATDSLSNLLREFWPDIAKKMQKH